METTKENTFRTYIASEVVWFRKTKEAYGGLSNMASGFPLWVNDMPIFSSEALYQACRFPHLPEVQEKILAERSPMTAKMVGKPYRQETRKDWDNIRIMVMRWCLRVKLAQNFFTFGKLLESTFDKPIVEDSKKDTFWGAVRDKENPKILMGTNALGRLLMELRQFYNSKRFSPTLFYVTPLRLPNFSLLGNPIQPIDERENFVAMLMRQLDLPTLIEPKRHHLPLPLQQETISLFT